MRNTSNKHLCPKTLSFLTPLSLSLFILHVTILTDGNSTTSYTPPDNILLNCGVAGNTTAQDDRNWVGDINSKFFPIEHLNKASVAFTALKQTPSIDRVPYFTARLSHSEFTYLFQVTPGQKFIRLYFYPASYPDFDRSEAFFSVKAGPYTLLSNFSASLTADSLDSDSIYKEFCLNVEENQRWLNITFTPSPSHPNAYSFINGIEIVSMPTNLYYSPSNSEGYPLIAQQNLFSGIDNNTALETVYRLNVGGSSISPNQDTGMFRQWSPDDYYLTEAVSHVLPVNTTIKLSYTKVQRYTAPAVVYTSARTMGTNKTINKSYNLTWEFSVDSGFIYLVRLHFCEFQFEVTKPSDREFQIFIANYTAEAYADVITWSGGNGVPVYKDYAVNMENEGKGSKRNISIALHPNPDSRTKYNDAILNGVEIFKLSKFDGNLAGPNPNPPPSTPPPPPRWTKVKPKKNQTAAIVGGVFSGVVALSFFCFLLLRLRKESTWWVPFFSSGSKSKDSKSRNKSSLPSDLCRHFSIDEINTATNNFDKACIIGAGGFGNVYKGDVNIDNVSTPVAIKRLNPGSQQGAQEFKTEIEMLSQLRHLHLVSLIGYCNDGREMILVYDYMARGTLRDHLYKSNNPPLTWKQRLQICIGTAKGLNHLHTGAKHKIIHRDVKTTNILLDENWVAKVSDFGLSKLGPTSTSKAHVSTVVKGSIGYLDPEYYFRQQLTEKSDVYSFGVVLFEVLCARPPVNQILPKEQVSLAEWARRSYHNGTLYQTVDLYLNGKIAPECFKKFGEVAFSCLLDDGTQRPTMSDVVWELEFALQLQETAEERIKFSGSLKEMNSLDSEVRVLDDGDREVFSSSSGQGSNSLTNTEENSLLSENFVFSEIMNSKGR